MSAIAAVFCRDGGEPPQQRLAEVSAALSLFGTGMATERSGPTCIVRAASTGFTPEDAGDAGIVAIGGGRLLAFDGCLHHRPDLVAALGQPHSRDWADAALFARAWERWGEGAVGHADGEFAAIVWDPAGKTLTALCSPLRAPPLYFSVNSRRAIVATAPRAIFAWGDLPRRLDDAHLAGSLVLHSAAPRATYYRDVQSLAPGETLTVAPDSWRTHQHYELAERVRPVRLPRQSDYVDAAGELVRAAVGSAMRSVETPSILLSGGLDSTTVAVTALDILQGQAPGGAPLTSFTGVPEAEWDGRVLRWHVGDEGPLVRLLRDARPELDARFVDAAGLGLDHELTRMIELAEAPPRNPNNQPWLHECLRLSRAAGRRTLLTGGVGNATLSFGGLPRLAALLRAGRWRTLWREAAALDGRETLKTILKRTVPPHLPAWACAKANARFPSLGSVDWRSYSPIHPSFAGDMGVEGTARRQRLNIYHSLAGSCREQQMRMLLGPASAHQRSLTLARSAIHDVAERSPLGDRRLVEWCLGLPDEQYLHLGQDRRLVRGLMRGRLPAEVLAGPVDVQGADWHLRLGRSLRRVRSTFEDWRSDPEVAGRLDLDRLLRALDNWPTRTPLSPADHPEQRLIRQGVGWALAHGRFIRWATNGAQG